LVRAIEEQVAKRAAAADTDVNAQMTGIATATANAPPAAPAATPTRPAFDPSVIALLSVAFGSLAAAFATVLAFLDKWPLWKLPFAAIGVMLIISGPSVILAFIKLRKRNLGPILDANGWAVNAKASINVPFGTSLTRIAKLPPGSTVDVNDKFAQKSAVWPKVVLVLFAILWAYAILDGTGLLYRMTHGGEAPPAKSSAADGKSGTNAQAPPATAAPAAAPAPAAPAK
jgi:hypothetical protein